MARMPVPKSERLKAIGVGRDEAVKRSMRFFHGTRCAHGHEGIRYVSTGACVQCMKLLNFKNRHPDYDAIVANGDSRRKAEDLREELELRRQLREFDL